MCSCKCTQSWVWYSASYLQQEQLKASQAAAGLEELLATLAQHVLVVLQIKVVFVTQHNSRVLTGLRPSAELGS